MMIAVTNNAEALTKMAWFHNLGEDLPMLLYTFAFVLAVVAVAWLVGERPRRKGLGKYTLGCLLLLGGSFYPLVIGLQHLQENYDSSVDHAVGATMRAIGVLLIAIGMLQILRSAIRDRKAANGRGEAR